MRKFCAIAIIALTAVLGAEHAAAQVRGPAYAPRAGTSTPRPMVPKLIIPPSAAVRAALTALPKAKPLGVRAKGSVYIVKLKQGGRIIQLNVNAATGAVMPKP